MPIIRRLSLLALLISAAGLLVSCVPVPPNDPALAQQGVYVQQAAAPGPLPTATAAVQTTQLEPTATAAATLAPAEPTGTPAAIPQIEPTGTPITVTIALANPSANTATLAPTESPLPTLAPTIRFTDTPAPTNTPRPTSTVAAIPTRAPTLTPAAASAAAAAPTVDPHLIVITEADIAAAVAGGAAAQQGVTIDNLKVRFADGKTYITADRLGYGIIKMQNLDLVGRLVAQDGVLSLAVESISPRGLAANFLPTAVNQALANFGAQWYVEDVRTLDGQVELRVR
jgi:hypothetical protein